MSTSAPNDTTPARASEDDETRVDPDDAPQDAPLESTDGAKVAPEEPYTVFTTQERRLVVSIASIAAILSPICSAIFLPAVPAISADLGVSIQRVNLLLTVFLIWQGLAPTLWSGLGDNLGRRLTIIGTLVVFLAANLGLSFADQYGVLVFLRCLQAFGSASVIAVGAGAIGDVTPRANRGSALGYFQLVAMGGPSLGPILGGALAGSAGWHSIFWLLSGLGGAVLLLVILFLPETLRSIVGNGTIPPPRINRPLIRLGGRRAAPSTAQPPTPPRKGLGDIDWLAPLRVLTHLDLLLVLLFGSWTYVVFFLMQTTLTSQLSSAYHLDETIIGVCYLGSGGGSVLAGYTWGKVLDWEYKRFKARFDEGKKEGDQEKAVDGADFPIERARLRTLFPMSVVMFSAALGYGWALDRHAPLAVIIILTFIIAYGCSAAMNSVTVYAVDLFPSSAAGATASLNLLRCELGAAGTAAVDPLVRAIGAGPTFSIAFGVGIVSLALPACSMRWGPRWRRRREAREDERGKAVDRR